MTVGPPKRIISTTYNKYVYIPIQIQVKYKNRSIGTLILLSYEIPKTLLNAYHFSTCITHRIVYQTICNKPVPKIFNLYRLYAKSRQNI